MGLADRVAQLRAGEVRYPNRRHPGNLTIGPLPGSAEDIIQAYSIVDKLTEIRDKFWGIPDVNIKEYSYQSPIVTTSDRVTDHAFAGIETTERVIGPEIMRQGLFKGKKYTNYISHISGGGPTQDFRLDSVAHKRAEDVYEEIGTGVHVLRSARESIVIEATQWPESYNFSLSLTITTGISLLGKKISIPGEVYGSSSAGEYLSRRTWNSYSSDISYLRGIEHSKVETAGYELKSLEDFLARYIVEGRLDVKPLAQQIQEQEDKIAKLKAQNRIARGEKTFYKANEVILREL